MIDWTTEEFLDAEIEQAFADNPALTLEEAILLRAEMKEEQALAVRIMLCGNSGGSKYKLYDNLKVFHNPKMLFGLITDVYTNDGYNFPRSVIQKAKSLAREIPQEERLRGLPEGDPVTVYRADSWWNTNFLSPVKTAPSWTTNKNVAIWFAYRWYWSYKEHGEEPPAPPLTIWKAEIPRNKIIAYLTDRDEFEVLQHNNVKKLEILPPPTDEEIRAVFEERKRTSEQHT